MYYLKIDIRNVQCQTGQSYSLSINTASGLEMSGQRSESEVLPEILVL